MHVLMRSPASVKAHLPTRKGTEQQYVSRQMHTHRGAHKNQHLHGWYEVLADSERTR